MIKTLCKKIKEANVSMYTYICMAACLLLALYLPVYFTGATTIQLTGNGLVGYWTFDEGGGTTAYDHSGNGYAGTLQNSPTWTGGIRSGALSFNGSNSSVSFSSTPLTVTNNWTMSAWVYPATINQVGQIVQNGYDNCSSGSGYAFGIGNGGGGQGTRLEGVASGIRWIDSGYDFPTANAWYYVVMEDNNGTTMFYVNGIQTPGTANAGYGVPTQLSIGSGMGCRYFNGKIDDVRLYSRPLTVSEIKSQYVSGGNMVSVPTANSLLGHWSFDDATGTIAHDSSGNGYNGSLINNPVWTSGKLGVALSFNGTSQYIDIGSPSGLNLHSAMTASAWFYLNSTSGAQTILFGDYGGGSPLYNVTINQDGAGIVRGEYFGSGGGSSDYYVKTAAVSAKAWHQVVMTRNSSGTISMYVDGVLSNAGTSGTAGSVNSAALTDFTIGRPGSYNGQYFNGKIDDVRVYGRALSAPEVSTLYSSSVQKIIGETNLSVNSANSGLIGYWSFDGPDLNSTTAFDRSGQGNNGTLINGPTPTIGKLGQALSFNGNNTYIKVNSLSSITLPLSASMWVKLNSEGTSGDSNSVLFGLRFYLALDSAHGLEYWAGYWLHTSTVIPTGSWNQITLVSTSGGTTIYLNGQQVFTYTVPLSLSSGALEIGGRDDGYLGSPYTVNGSIDDVRVYNRALSASEAKALYTMGK